MRSTPTDTLAMGSNHPSFEAVMVYDLAQVPCTIWDANAQIKNFQMCSSNKLVFNTRVGQVVVSPGAGVTTRIIWIMTASSAFPDS